MNTSTKQAIGYGIFFVLIIGLVVWILFWRIEGAIKDQAQRPTEYSIDRMRTVSHEKIIRDDYIFNFYTFWDSETGQEIMCIRNDNCWLTGRKIDDVK